MNPSKRQDLRTQRRRVAAAFDHWRACQDEAARRRVQLGQCVHERVASAETISLAFVAGLTVAMLVPQGQRGDPPEQRRPAQRNRALKMMLRLGRRFAIRGATSAIAG